MAVILMSLVNVGAAEEVGARPKREPQLLGALLEGALIGNQGYGGYGGYGENKFMFILMFAQN
jgi:hypothetical protein